LLGHPSGTISSEAIPPISVYQRNIEMPFQKFTFIDSPSNMSTRTMPKSGDLIRNQQNTGNFINIILSVSSPRNDDKGIFVYIRSVRFAKYNARGKTPITYLKGTRSRSFKFYVSVPQQSHWHLTRCNWQLVKLQKAVAFKEQRLYEVIVEDGKEIARHIRTVRRPYGFVDVDNLDQRMQIVEALKDVDTTYKAPEGVN